MRRHMIVVHLRAPGRDTTEYGTVNEEFASRQRLQRRVVVRPAGVVCSASTYAATYMEHVHWLSLLFSTLYAKVGLSYMPLKHAWLQSAVG